MLRLFLATLHLLALGIGLGAVWARARALSERPFDIPAAHRTFTADNWWGLAAGLWIVTGVWRLRAGTEKATSYYMNNDVFRGKLLLFLVILALELVPMITLIRWRRTERKSPDTWRPSEGIAKRLARISYVEVALLVAIVAAAVTMARGYGSRGTG
jgi:putative membrane protein